jgi:uncharacterized protein
MGLFYFDTSSIVKLYINEPGSQQAVRLVNASLNNQIATSVLTRIEMRSALRRKIRRNEIDDADGISALTKFESHWQTRFVLQPLTDLILDKACALIDRHQLRSYDAIQLASCLALPFRANKEELVFVCSDLALNDAAFSEGLRAVDPEESDELS